MADASTLSTGAHVSIASIHRSSVVWSIANATLPVSPTTTRSSCTGKNRSGSTATICRRTFARRGGRSTCFTYSESRPDRERNASDTTHAASRASPPTAAGCSGSHSRFGHRARTIAPRGQRDRAQPRARDLDAQRDRSQVAFPPAHERQLISGNRVHRLDLVRERMAAKPTARYDEYARWLVLNASAGRHHDGVGRGRAIDLAVAIDREIGGSRSNESEAHAADLFELIEAAKRPRGDERGTPWIGLTSGRPGHLVAIDVPADRFGRAGGRRRVELREESLERLLVRSCSRPAER